MALIAKEAMKYPIFREIVSTARYTCPQTNLELERHFVQTNLLLRKGPYRYPRAIGIKTGTTRAAGKTLIAAAKEGDRTLIAVVLGSKDIKGRYDDVIQLFEAAFNQPKKRCHVLPKGVQSLSAAIAGSKSSLKTYLTEGLYYDFYPSEEPHIKVTVQWNALSLPIEKDQEVGRVKVVDASGKVLQVQQLFAAERIEPSTWYRVKSLFAKKTGMRKLVFFIGIGVIVTYLVLLRSKKRQRSRRMY